MSEQCRVKLAVGQVKSQGGVDGIEDVITSFFLKPNRETKQEVLLSQTGYAMLCVCQ